MEVTLIILGLIAVIYETNAAYRRICYYTNWSQYTPAPAKYFPENVDTNLCTHLLYAFANLTNNELHPTEWNDETLEQRKGMFEKLNDLKKEKGSLKTLLSVGGWSMGSTKFSTMVRTVPTRQRFVTSTVKYLRKWNFDGLDIDWENPGMRGSPPEDKHRYVQLLKEIHGAFVEEGEISKRPRLILSAAVPAGKHDIDTGYDIPAISRYLDMVNLMAYDIHGPWDSRTGFNSPLYKRSDETGDQTHLNMDWAAQYWTSHGTPKEKLNVGMGLYGQSFTMKTPSSIRPGESEATAGHMGTYSKEAGSLTYYEICKMLETGGTRHWDNEQMVPYVVKGDQWVGYDDEQSLKIKVDYVKKNKFGGIMVWSLELDDFHAMCHGGIKYPLLTAIDQALRNASHA